MSYHKLCINTKLLITINFRSRARGELDFKTCFERLRGFNISQKFKLSQTFASPLNFKNSQTFASEQKELSHECVTESFTYSYQII